MISNNQETPVAYLPESLTVIGLHLDCRDLLSCVQVCRLWSQLFTPFAWRTMDGEHFSKPKIDIEEGDARTHKQVFKAWLHDIFTQHGQHVRHLTAHWDSTVKAAVTTRSCTRLTSLTVVDVSRLIMMGDDAEKHLTGCQRSEEYTNHLLSPLLKIFIPSVGELCSKGCIKVWKAAQRNWLLILANSLLDSLNLGSLAWIDSYPMQEQFMFNTLAPLTNLSWLKNDICVLRLRTLLELFPNLCHYSCGYEPCGFRPTKRRP